ncbi:hypothetical protein BACCOP_01258 [Phocaeicola coprocola DSM 17136]|uniref:Uncharacterized protein n=1 Tax=Phocaeicola coprocola DSM 17136 TaxID=470145 RepID=B3JHA2_9BACT|nr:hypothetical protein BACCOP_01258 [Phocaeicola coprocola DSM 17136]
MMNHRLTSQRQLSSQWLEERREVNCSMIGNMPPKGVSLSDFIATFAMPVAVFFVFGFATLR